MPAGVRLAAATTGNERKMQGKGMEDNVPITRICTLCGQEKGLDHFYKAKLGKYGTTARCKPCHSQWAKDNKDRANATKKQWVERNLEKNLQIKRDYYHQNSEKCSAYRKQHYQLNKEHVSAVNKSWRERNLERVKENAKRYADENAEAIKEKARIYREANRESIRERRRLSYQKDKTKAYSDRHIYRARKNNAGGKFTMDQIGELAERQKYRCVVCKGSIRKKYHIDHIVPLSRGGTNYIENIQLLCPECNLQKGAKDPVEFMQSRGFLL